MAEEWGQKNKLWRGSVIDALRFPSWNLWPDLEHPQGCHRVLGQPQGAVPWLRALLFLLFSSFAFALTPAERIASLIDPAQVAVGALASSRLHVNNHHQQSKTR
jgi:hypothetical protein